MTMKPSLTVWWPATPTSSSCSSEDLFSVSFCRKESERVLEDFGTVQWIFFDDTIPVRSMLEETLSPFVLCVTEPTVLINCHAVARLFRSLEKFHRIVGPVFPDGPAGQRANPPFTYWDLATYHEVAQHCSAHIHDGPIPVVPLDPRCLLASRETLENVYNSCRFNPPAEFVRTLAAQGGLVDPGALVHVFGLVQAHAREDLAGLLPQKVKSLLDVGCATGLFGRLLRQSRPSLFLAGVEPDLGQARVAAPYYDRMYEVTFEEASIEETFDVVTCGDVLEHLVDPWNALKKMHRLLRPRGCLLLSVPNIGHWTVVRALLEGRFSYIPAGLLCRAHLRWFTKSSLLEALWEARFTVEIFEKRQPDPTPRGKAFMKAVEALGDVDLESLQTDGFLVRARAL